MVKVYGASDDLVEIEYSKYEEDEICCYNKDVLIEFFDGTIIRIGYPKKDLAVWWIEIEKEGNAFKNLVLCNNEDAQIYSDIFEIYSEVNKHFVVDRKYIW